MEEEIVARPFEFDIQNERQSFGEKNFKGEGKINLLNTQAKFEVSIHKTLDVTNKKPILIARLTKKTVGLEMGEN